MVNQDVKDKIMDAYEFAQQDIDLVRDDLPAEDSIESEGSIEEDTWGLDCERYSVKAIPFSMEIGLWSCNEKGFSRRNA